MLTWKCSGYTSYTSPHWRRLDGPTKTATAEQRGGWASDGPSHPHALGSRLQQQRYARFELRPYSLLTLDFVFLKALTAMAHTTRTPEIAVTTTGLSGVHTKPVMGRRDKIAVIGVAIWVVITIRIKVEVTEAEGTEVGMQGMIATEAEIATEPKDMAVDMTEEQKETIATPTDMTVTIIVEEEGITAMTTILPLQRHTILSSNSKGSSRLLLTSLTLILLQQHPIIAIRQRSQPTTPTLLLSRIIRQWEHQQLMAGLSSSNLCTSQQQVYVINNFLIS